MLARCPACSQRFPVVGSCETVCPFCETRVRVAIQRLVGAPQTAARARTEQRERGPALSAPFSAAPPRAASGGPPGPRAATTAPAPRTDFRPARLAWLLIRPGRFFARLEQGRPKQGPWIGGPILLAAGGVQGAAWSQLFDGRIGTALGALLGAALATALAIHLGGLYHAGLRILGAPQVALPRLSALLGYGFVPMLWALVPFAGLPVGLGTAAAAQVAGLARYLGLPMRSAAGLVAIAWLAFLGLLVAVGEGALGHG